MNRTKKNKAIKHYIKSKWDITAAFDGMDHSKVKLFIQTYVQCLVFQYLFLSIILVQNVCICLGANKSR